MDTQYMKQTWTDRMIAETVARGKSDKLSNLIHGAAPTSVSQTETCRAMLAKYPHKKEAILEYWTSKNWQAFIKAMEEYLV
jgi:hypothetical protein